MVVYSRGPGGGRVNPEKHGNCVPRSSHSTLMIRAVGLSVTLYSSKHLIYSDILVYITGMYDFLFLCLCLDKRLIPVCMYYI